MASLTLTASVFGGAAAISGQRSGDGRRSLLVKASASGLNEGEKSVSCRNDAEGNNSNRRAVMFAAAAAAISVIGGSGAVALAGEGDLKRGTPEAKKYYGPVCVTMPTARICHK